MKSLQIIMVLPAGSSRHNQCPQERCIFVTKMFQSAFEEEDATTTEAPTYGECRSGLQEFGGQMDTSATKTYAKGIAFKWRIARE